MRFRSSFAAALALVLLAQGTAAAGLLELSAQVHSGGMGGMGLFGEQKDDAFHKGAGGFTYGALLELEVLFFDAWIQHDQYLGDDGVRGTWTQFMIGADMRADLDTSYDDQGQEREPRWFGELGLGLGFGVGTGQQVDPPLDNSEVTDKGIVFQLEVGAGYRLNEILSFGVWVPVTTGYFLKSGEGAAANDSDNYYASMHFAAVLALRGDIRLQ